MWAFNELLRFFLLSLGLEDETRIVKNGDAVHMMFITRNVVGFLLLSSSLALAAGSVESGRDKSVLCAGCHGETGTSVSPLVPNLAGQKEAYLIKAIKDYRSGKRNDPMMASMVQGLSDSDIFDLAAYFSTQTLSAE